VVAVGHREQHLELGTLEPGDLAIDDRAVALLERVEDAIVGRELASD
jgi:hypothetical protein